MPVSTSSPDPLLVDARTAARLMGVSERHLWSLTAPRGPIPVVRPGGSRSVRYSIETLRRLVDQWQAQQQTEVDHA